MFTFKCVCGVGICDTHLVIDLVPEMLEGQMVRGLAIVEEDGKTTGMIIPDWLAQVIEKAIIEHQGVE